MKVTEAKKKKLKKLLENYVENNAENDLSKAYADTMKKQKSKRLVENVETEKKGPNTYETFSYSKPDPSLLKNKDGTPKDKYTPKLPNAWAVWNEECRVFDLKKWNKDGRPLKTSKYFFSVSGEEFNQLAGDYWSDFFVAYILDAVMQPIIEILIEDE